MAEKVTVRSDSTWQGGGSFEHRAGSDVPYLTDALLMGEEPRPLRGPRPMEMLLGAVCGCTGADIVSILTKMKVKLLSLSIGAEGTRAEQHPRIFEQVRITYRVETDPPDLEKVRRAVELSARKYCAASATLASAGEVRYRVQTGGEEFEGAIEGVPKRG